MSDDAELAAARCRDAHVGKARAADEERIRASQGVEPGLNPRITLSLKEYPPKCWNGNVSSVRFARSADVSGPSRSVPCGYCAPGFRLPAPQPGPPVPMKGSIDISRGRRCR